MSQDLSISRKFNWIALKNCTKETLGEYATGKAVKSLDFEIPIGNNITKWNLLFYPNGEVAEYSSHLSLYLNRKDSLKLPYQVEVKMWIVSKTKRIVESSFTRSINELKPGRGFAKLISHQSFKQHFTKLVFNGNLKFGIEIFMKQEDPTESVTPPALSTDFLLEMLEAKLYTDFELICSDRESLFCHKGILAARSPVFKAMFSNEMKEARQGFAKTPDFDSSIMRQVLRYIYNGTVETLDNISEKLIFAAEKYQLKALKKTCIDNIFKNLSKDNAIDVLLITEKINGCEMLFEKVVRVVAGNYAEVMKTEEWNRLPKTVLQKLIDRVMAFFVDAVVVI